MRESSPQWHRVNDSGVIVRVADHDFRLLAEARKALSEKALHDKYETRLKNRDDAIERLKAMEVKLSTSMVGETVHAQAA